MIAGTYNIEMDQGSTYRKVFTVKRNGDPEDLSGFDGARMKIKKKPGNAVIWASADHVNSLVLDGNAGTISLLIPANLTKDFTFTEAEYDIELYTTDESDVQKYLKGKVILDKEITT